MTTNDVASQLRKQGSSITFDQVQKVFELHSEMIDLIESYINNETQDFYGIVGKLEGALDASEIKEDSLINQWYDFWMLLETRRAVEGNQVNRTKAIKELIAMKEFLEKHI